MSATESYLDKDFVVADADCRIRREDNLMAYEMQGGDFKRIPQGSHIRIDAVRVVPTGSNGQLIFGHAILNGTPVGWTSTRNLEGRFVNETLGEVAPEAGASRYGPNAAWSRGKYIGQKTLVSIVDVSLHVERIALETLDAYVRLVDAARADGVSVAINSAFRSYAEQKILYDGFQHHLPGYNKAAKPGSSNHQSGIAFDIPVAGAAGHPVYDWLTRHAPDHGFVRTVSGEPWHWEYRPADAAQAVADNTFKVPGIA
ncbi:M15 family metallopeptidase [Methylobacterium nonmethylotrophicum]|uniref:D-alanyl-D-alanine carboxypeptidase-like core domain-containing protein n=1 Tax=Methylobacterium nonmethylotrophicum TaxID=1141884 RepID=A0A4Z0NQ71_9HYPH|nr:M15 family metallopeptidase [Methylobacterium nonmethylotrophicum]TGD98331.1 hypothetical protein EU555_16630 [Methylobacterium nonmethylotrophicum]